MNRMGSICFYLDRMFRQLNDDKFGGELEVPVITVQDTPRAYGHITCSRVWKNAGGGEGQYELNIDAGTLDRPIASVASTMLHEMVHLHNMMHGIKDCSRGGTYHNKRFREKAEEAGLSVGHDPRTGWSRTGPSVEFASYIINRGWEDIPAGRHEGSGGGAPGAGSPRMRKPSSTRKYQCPGCRMSVRATKEVSVICAGCRELLQPCQ